MAEQTEEKNESESCQSEKCTLIEKDGVDTNKAKIGVPKRGKKKKSKKLKQNKEQKNYNQKINVTTKPQSPPVISSKSTFAQIAKELKAKRLEQLAYAAAMAKKKKKNRVLRDEELYTDKDRAAAVNMGTRDIKQSLKQRKKDDKNFDPQMSEEAEPSTLLVLGNNELRNGDLKIALAFMNKALELNPDDKNGLVARSKCYLLLGDAKLALQDAETVLQSDKTFVRAIYQKAEALYHLGDFEHSLMYYHQGHRLRPELESFRLGVQKAQEAIENIIGTTHGPKKISSRLPSSKRGSSKNEKPSSVKSSNETDLKRSASSLTSSNRTNRESNKSAGQSSRRLLGELGIDRLYLENLIKHPDLKSSNQEAVNIIKAQAEEGINFLKNRQEFWRQQKPSNISGKLKGF